MAELVRKKTSALPLLAAGSITGKEFFSVGYQGSNYRVLLEELKTYIGVSGGGGGSVDLTSVLSDVVPFADNSYTLGAEGNHWKRVYVNDIDSDGDLTLSPGGNVLIPGSDLEVGGSIYMDGQLLSTRAYVDGMLSGKASADALSSLVGRVTTIEEDYLQSSHYDKLVGLINGKVGMGEIQGNYLSLRDGGIVSGDVDFRGELTIAGYIIGGSSSGLTLKTNGENALVYNILTDAVKYALKSDIPTTTDQIGEGNNLYFTKQRALDATNGTYLPIDGTAKGAETAGTAASAGYANRAGQATNDSAGNKIVDTYLKISDYNTSLEGLATEDYVNAQGFLKDGNIRNLVIKKSDGTELISYRPTGSGAALTLQASHVGLGNVRDVSSYSQDEIGELLKGYLSTEGGMIDGTLYVDGAGASIELKEGAIRSTLSGTDSWSIDDSGNGIFNSLKVGGKIPMYSGDAYTKSEANKEFQQKGSYLTSSDLIGYLKPDGNGLVSHSGSFEIIGADGVIYLENGGIKGTLYGVDSWSIDDEGNGLFSSLKVGDSVVLTSSTVLQHLPLSEYYRSLILRSDGLSVRLGSKTSSAHLGKDKGFSTNGGLCISTDLINGGLSIKLGTTADCYEGVGLRISSNPSDADYGSLCVNYDKTLRIESGGSQLGVRLSSASGLGINYDGICVKCGTGLRISTYASNELYVPLGTGLAWVDNMLVSTVEGGSSISETVRSGGTINLSSATASSLNSLANSLPTNGIALYLVTDSRGDLPSLYGETFIQVSASGVPYLFGRSGSFGVSVGDLLAITKTSFGITQCRIIPLNDAKPATTAYGSVGADGLCTVWDKGQINRISTIADVAYAALPSSRQLPSLWADNMNEALSTGVYPWCTLGRPDGSLGAYTCVTHRSSTPDGSGYYTIEQTAYGRQDELGKVYKRIIFWKDSSTYEYGRWILIGE